MEARSSGLCCGEPRPRQRSVACESSFHSVMNGELPAIGFPSDNIQVFEIYNSIAQTHARTHPSLVSTQRALLELWHTSDPATRVSMRTPISYYDRFRIRLPGDSVFTLGPHIDGGSLERWEDPGFRRCWSRILSGRWREHDPFDVSPRIGAKQDLYHGT